MDFIKKEFFELYPKSQKIWDKNAALNEHLQNQCLVLGKRIRQTLWNKTRCRRGYKPLFQDYSFLFNQAQYVDDETKGNYEKAEFDNMICTGMSIQN